MIYKLMFGRGNSKLDKKIYTFSLPAGWTCPCANECLSKSNPDTGKITDGKETKYRCFAASQEAIYHNVRLSRWNNFKALKTCKSLGEMVELINGNLPINAEIIRVHVSGDFFNEMYFKAWMEVARINPHIIFYGYTKRVSLLVKFKQVIPENFRFVASVGGTEDKEIFVNRLKYAVVVFSENEAKRLKLELDHKDDHAYSTSKKSFALLLHGNQPKGTKAAKVWYKLKKAGKGYSFKIKKKLVDNQLVNPILKFI